MTQKQMQGEVQQAEKTAAEHRKIQQKIDARNRVEIAAWAWESGVVHER